MDSCSEGVSEIVMMKRQRECHNGTTVLSSACDERQLENRPRRDGHRRSFLAYPKWTENAPHSATEEDPAIKHFVRTTVRCFTKINGGSYGSVTKLIEGPRKQRPKRLLKEKQTNKTKSSEETFMPCSPGLFKCDDHTCLPNRLVCNFRQHRSHGSDESEATCSPFGRGISFKRRSDSWNKHWLYALLLLLQVPSVLSTAVCPENQTTELGRQGSIICHFPDEYREVHWFDSISDGSFPVITFKPNEGDKYGPGLDSGTYDVLEDGSLIVTTVSTWHERSYKAIVYLESSFATFVVSLKVMASPVDDLPMIPCCNCHQGYYFIAMQGENLSCSFNATRPPVQLEWLKKIGINLEMQQFNTTENSNGTFNSLATVHLLEGSNFIQLLVCRGTWLLSDWKKEREVLVDFSSNVSFSDVAPKVQHMEINRYAQIQCGQSTSDYVVWKRIIPNRGPEIMGFHSPVMTKTISDIPDVEVSAEGSLTFASPSVQHEGMYVCIFGDGQKEEIQMTSLEILIPPSPPYIQIAGCDGESYRCVIREDSTKNLTCAVYGARPNVTLKWIAEDEDEIAFFNHKEVFKERGETSDTILSVQYKVSQDVLCGEEILIKCHLNGPLSNIIKADSTALVIPASCRENGVKEEYGLNGFFMPLLVASCVLCTLVWTFVINYIFHRRRITSRSTVRSFRHDHGDSPDKLEIKKLQSRLKY